VRKRKTWRESEQLFYVQSQEGAALETHTPSILSRRLSKASQSSTEGLKLVNWIARRQSLLCQPAADQQHFRDGHAHDDINSGRGLIKAPTPRGQGIDPLPACCVPYRAIGNSRPGLKRDRSRMERALTFSGRVGIGRGQFDRSFYPSSARAPCDRIESRRMSKG
jgi:hypothetical protein